MKKKRVWIPLLILAVLVITYLVGPVPGDPAFSDDWIEVPDSPQALERYVTQSEDSMPVRKDNEARIIWNDSVQKVTEYSFVYLHGFAGSYRDGYPLNVNVAEAFGANIYLARWAGHGLKPPFSLNPFSPEAAWQSAKEALAIGRRIGEKVVVMSTSTGGTLAIMLAAHFPDSVHGLVNIAPNIKDDQIGASLLGTPWGYEIAWLVSLGENKKVRYEEERAAQYWDTIYPAEALVELQILVGSSMEEETFSKVQCPVLTLFYQKNFLEEDEHVEVDEFPEMHAAFSTPDSMLELVAMERAGTHFIGSQIKSSNYKGAQERVIEFCRTKLGMTLEEN